MVCIIEKNIREIGVSFVLLQTKNYTFFDFYNNKVELSFEKDYFSKQPKHVWVICKYKEEWLLTRHEDRGIEFPGGKVEERETADEAAVREVYEETGGIVENLVKIGQYKVTARNDVVIKNIYFAKISTLKEKDHYFETAGPVLLKTLPNEIKQDKQYSFIMKDGVLTNSLQWLERHREELSI